MNGLFLAQQPNAGQGRLMLEVSRSHTVTAVGRTFLDEGSARRRVLYLTTHNSQQTDVHAPSRIRTRIPSKRAAVDPRLTPRGHWSSEI